MSSPLINYVRGLPQKALDTVGQLGEPLEHGVEMAKSMLGFPRPQAGQDPRFMAPVQDVQKAYDSFQKPDLMQMKKPLQKGK